MFLQLYALFTCDVRRCVCLPHLCFRKQVEQMLQWIARNQAYTKFAALFLLCYVFLLRLPSEALPARLGKGSLHLEGDQLVLNLARR